MPEQSLTIQHQKNYTQENQPHMTLETLTIIVHHPPFQYLNFPTIENVYAVSASLFICILSQSATVPFSP